ncbi:MAG: GNAT family N-acetyltransferase [Hamadaea sp.]|nr:GNAT family N-acetyltransferase [Hamadaea sp.]NUR48050.1 GNAT family N-acetyltransferase [Hamadaea sp.]NUT05286.1 GNAT family N-acetyltransferase [Hamadaea sp.]
MMNGTSGLEKFLTEWLGGWPGTPGLTVVGSALRTQPSWDGSVREVVGVRTPDGGVLSVPPELADAVRSGVRDWAEVDGRLPAALGRPAARVFAGVFRWSTEPADLPDAGEWVPITDPRVPPWLHPFGGDALIAFAEDGTYAAGVGIKRHNAAGMEISVGTEEAYRGQGLAARLVAQAARWILAAGAVPIYLHDPANVASDRTALRAGFPDEGWKIIGVFG